MLNNSVVSFNDHFGLIFKGSEDKVIMTLKIGRFRPPTINWCLLTREP